MPQLLEQRREEKKDIKLGYKKQQSGHQNHIKISRGLD